MKPASMVLVVGGGRAEHEAVEAVLADTDCMPAFAGNVAEGLAQIQVLLPDLILLATGLDAGAICQRVRSEPYLGKTPILVAIGRGDEASRSQALAAGADDFVAWPPDPIELRVRLRSLARLARHQRQLQQEIGRRNRELLSLQSTSAAITSSLDLAVVLDTVSREMAHLLDMQACTIWQWSPEAHRLSLLARYDPEGWWGGQQPAKEWHPASLPSTDQVLQDQQAQQITAGQSGVGPAELAYMQRLGIETILKLPMVFAGRAMGLVEVLGDETGRVLTADEITLTQLLANQAASAIENARLYEAIRRHVAEITTLNKISQVITSILDLHETLSIIADHTIWLLGVAAASVILYDEESGDLWFGASSGEGADFIRGKRLEVGQGIVNWVIQNGEPLLVQDVAQDARFFSNWDEESGFTTRSILCVPLRSKGRTIGAIETINKASGPFDQEDLSLLTSMAASAAIAIDNARLYEQAQQEIAERKRVEAKLQHLYQELQDHAARLEETVAERTRELQRERDRTQAILEAVGEAVIVTDLEGSIRYVNPAAVELTGYAAEEVVGRSPRIWQQEQPLTEFYAASGPGATQTQRAEVVSRRKDGTLYDAAMTVAPLFDSHHPERLVGHVCVQRDITPIKEAEQLKDQFVSNVSHELRTPLSIITLLSGNLDRLYGRLGDEKRHKMIRDIRDQAQVLNNLVGDVLEISRIESGRVSMERQRVNLAQLAREETEKQLPLARKKLQALRATGAEEAPVWGHPDQLRQVIRNLLNNAIKFTPNRGQITCECLACASAELAEEAWPGSAGLPAGDWAALRVVDTGIGIGPEELPHLYERFYRAKTQGPIPGTGLGLSIAQELIELHKGQIAAASTLGEGSIFAIYVPLLEE
jgi:PAS domain S-box-containing protein